MYFKQPQTAKPKPAKTSKDVEEISTIRYTRKINMFYSNKWLTVNKWVSTPHRRNLKSSIVVCYNINKLTYIRPDGRETSCFSPTIVGEGIIGYNYPE